MPESNPIGTVLYRIGAVVSAAVLLVGCALPPADFMIYGERYHPGYDYGELQYYNGDKEMAVAVFNPPFEEREAASEPIALSMRGKNRGSRISFTAAPGPFTPKLTEIVIAFDLPASDDGYAYCSGQTPGKATETADMPLTMVMVYCKRNAFVSSVRARMPRPASVADPAFQGMLAEAVRRLLPRPLPLYDDNQREDTRRLIEEPSY